MGNSIRKIYSFLSIAGDLCILNFLLFSFCLNSTNSSLDSKWFVIFLLENLIWIVLIFALNLASLTRIKQRKKITTNILLAMLILFFFFLFLNFFIRGTAVFSIGLLNRFVITAIAILVWKLLLDTLAHYFRKYGFNPHNVLIIGYNQKAEELKEFFITNSWSGYHFKGFIDEGKETSVEIAGNYSDLKNIVSSQKIDELFLNLSEIPDAYRASIMSMANELRLGIKLIPDLGDFPAYYHNYQRFDMMPVISVSKDSFSDSTNFILKRSFDLIFSIMFSLVVLSWLTPILAIIIKLNSKGPVFFRQKRTGYHNKTFTCLKFRTMVENTDADTVQATENDSRVTAVGKFLRKTGIDELSQIFNVLAGQMSIVGPRPHMLQHTEEYSRQIPHYIYRHYFKPGITGLAQISGYRGEIKDLEKMRNRIEQDIFYIENWSLWLDLKIIFITIAHIFRGEKRITN
jgi:putative colanic acid biosysnthesis UDP-glucose lipid carrier transferase